MRVICWKCQQPTLSNGICLNPECSECVNAEKARLTELDKLQCEVDKLKQEKITSSSGGTRQRLNRRYDLLFQEFGGALDAWAEIIDYGEKVHGHLNWHKLDFTSEQSPLNHAIGHLRKAAAARPGDPYRRRQLAKVLWNVAAQMWWDAQQTDPTTGP